MKKKIIAFWGFYEEIFKSNKLFLNKSDHVRHDGNLKFNLLYEYLIKNNFHVTNLNEINIDEIDVFVCFDKPRLNNLKLFELLKKKIPKILFLEESDQVVEGNFDKKIHNLFDTVFTWNDELIDNIKYFKFNAHYITYDIQNLKISNNFKKIKYCLVSSNRSSLKPFNGYDIRKLIIDWFEKNKKDQFNFFGKGWDQYYLETPFKLINRLNSKKVPNFIKQKFKSKYFYYSTYKGEIDNKIQVLNEFDFNFAIENFLNIPGYITEKIFDSFYSGSIPIYLGANNISEYIPSSCFIDLRDFQSIKDLYEFTNDLSLKKKNEFINSAREFFNSEKSKNFKIENYLTNTLNQINLLLSKNFK